MLLANRDRKLLNAIALYQKNKARSGFLAKVWTSVAKVQYIFWSIISGSDIHRDANIDLSTRFPHPTGVVIHAKAVIEKNCLIMQQVTLGQTAEVGAPHLEEGVYVGSGAKILGNITIGRHARIGANAVVMDDIPPYTTAVGIPARIVKTRLPDGKKD